jgi:hypothetical protein
MRPFQRTEWPPAPSGSQYRSIAVVPGEGIAAVYSLSLYPRQRALSPLCQSRLWLDRRVAAAENVSLSKPGDREADRLRLDADAELAQFNDRSSAPADRVGREWQRERHPVCLAQRLAVAEDAVGPGVGSTVRPTASSRRMNSRTSFLIPVSTRGDDRSCGGNVHGPEMAVCDRNQQKGAVGSHRRRYVLGVHARTRIADRLHRSARPWVVTVASV